MHTLFSFVLLMTLSTVSASISTRTLQPRKSWVSNELAASSASLSGLLYGCGHNRSQCSVCEDLHTSTKEIRTSLASFNSTGKTWRLIWKLLVKRFSTVPRLWGESWREAAAIQTLTLITTVSSVETLQTVELEVVFSLRCTVVCRERWSVAV